jgi:hypothetical protein
VIAPEPREGINKQTSLLVLLRNNLFVAALIFAGLEFWRPYFFLTDDNLDGGFPFFTEVGRHLLAGHSPFVSNSLFGGGYDLLRDPTYFSWHPVYLAASLLTGTPLHFGIMDADAFVFLMLATAGFVTLSHHLRREMPLTVSDGWIMFYALSYTYTMVALTTGASWLTFLGNVSALPWLVLGILQRSGWKGVGIVLVFTIHQVLGGHLAPTISGSIFLSFFALGVAIYRRSALPLTNWLFGYALAVVVMLPLLFPVVEGVLASARSQGVTLPEMQENNIPPDLFAMSLFFGMALWLTHPFDHPNVTYTISLGSAAAVWCILPALVPPVGRMVERLGRAVWSIIPGSPAMAAATTVGGKNVPARWRGLELVTLAMLIFCALLICRPIWISEIMVRLPLFRSLRWPFREMIEFQFFLHLFLLIRPPGFTYVLRRFLAVLGTCVFVVPLVLYPVAPTFNPMTWDRELVLSGGFDQFWNQVRPLLKPTDRIAAIIPLPIYQDDRFEEPYSLLGTYNYAALAGVINAWGYSPTVPKDQVYTKTYAYYPFGAYHPLQKEALMRERPDLKFITLESLYPLRITLSSLKGPTIDLTPFVPVRHSRSVPHRR